MADTTTTSIARPAPYIEAAGQNLLDITTGLAGQPIDTSKFAPQIAGQNIFSQQAQQQAASQAGLGSLTFDPTTGAATGMGQGTGIAGYQPFLNQAQAYSGPQAYQQFMSPYQNDVINTTLQQFDIQAQKGLQPLQANAVAQGAFGGARQGIEQASYQSQSDLNRAALQAQLLNQGYTQANTLANQAYAQQSQLASLQPSLAQSQIQQLGQAGTSNLAYQQAVLDAQRQAATLAYQEPFTRLQALGSGIGGLLAGYPQPAFAQSTQQAPSTSPLSSALGAAAGIYGLGSLFGGK
jgi:hypothetical protein